MKRHVQNAGTKKWFGDYLVELESEPLKAIDKMASAYDGCVISGAGLTLVSGTTYNVAEGLVVLKIDGAYKVAPLPATNNVNVSVQKAIRIVKTAVTGQYQVPVDLTIAYNYAAEIIDYVAGLGTLNQDYLLIPTNGAAIRSYRDAIQNASYRFVTDTEKNTWNSKAAGAHTHAATDITQTASYRFVTDTEKLGFWSGTTTELTTLKKVCIGHSTPSAKLHVISDTTDVLIIDTASDISSTFRLKRNTVEFGTLYAAGGSVDFNIRASQATGGLVFMTGGSNARMTILSGGNIGIGISSPEFPLDVRAALSVVQIKSTTGTNAALLTINNTGGDVYIGRERSTGGYFGGLAYAFVLSAQGTYPMQFAVNNSVKVTILNTGNFGIGTTAPKTLLDISTVGEAIPTLGTAGGKLTLSNGGSYGLNAGVSTDGYTWFQAQRFDAATAYNICFQFRGGNFGIGTVTPAQKLEVSGAADIYSQVTATGADSKSGYILANDARSFAIRIDGADGDKFQIRDNTANAQRVTIDSNGNFGIANTAPSEKLDVTGNIKSSGTVSGEYITTTKGIKPKEVLSGTKTANQIFDAIAPSIPNIGDMVIISGGTRSGAYMHAVSHAIRNSSTVILIYGIRTDGLLTLNVTDGATDSYDVSLAW